MGINAKSTIRKISMLTLGLLIDLKERISNMVQSRDSMVSPKMEDPDEETPGFEGILPTNENKPEAWAQTDGQPSSDIVVSEEADPEPSYTGNPGNVVFDDYTGDKEELWQDEMDPSSEEDIPLRPSEVDIPHEIQYDKEDDLRIITPGQVDSEIEIPEEDFEEENPEENEIDPVRSQGNHKKGNRKMKGRSKGK